MVIKWSFMSRDFSSFFSFPINSDVLKSVDDVSIILIILISFKMIRYLLILCIKHEYVFFISVAVIACFLVCWTPYHVQRIIFLFTTLTESWSKRIASIQGTLHVVSGMFEYTFSQCFQLYNNYLYPSSYFVIEY